ncbi:MAG: hypothetical protein IK102_06820 [Treponema sp.]|nr:hypothetical protein [Treponema sp.]
MEFSLQNHGFKRYNIPGEIINSGESYVVIIQFSNGIEQKSDIMVK